MWTFAAYHQNVDILKIADASSLEEKKNDETKKKEIDQFQ